MSLESFLSMTFKTIESQSCSQLWQYVEKPGIRESVQYKTSVKSSSMLYQLEETVQSKQNYDFAVL